MPTNDRNRDGRFASTGEIMEWLAERNRAVDVSVERMRLADLKGWHFDGERGDLVHDTGRFFSIVGVDVMTNVGCVNRWSQPIVNQPEVGYLGIICKEFGGQMYFLMQAKIEPGNVNCVQLSPTLQATRSNYMQVHGGRKPAYLEYFQNVKPGQILVDQLQSEQGARFLRKRNRNMIVKIDDDVEVGEDFKWLTLGQIKELVRHDNTVNMDTRTVLSGLNTESCRSPDEGAVSTINDILHWLSELKTKYELVVERIPLKNVRGWEIRDDEIVRPDRNFFRVVGVNVSISNREVVSWCQPIVEPMQEGLCVLFRKRIGGTMHYLLQAKVECGNFDVVELAPTIQCLTGPYKNPIGYVPSYLEDFINGKLAGTVVLDVKQSEEGGRFFREQNRNVVYELDESVDLPAKADFMWLTMPQMKEFLRFNNYLNIQVRSLISAL